MDLVQTALHRLRLELEQHLRRWAIFVLAFISPLGFALAEKVSCNSWAEELRIVGS